MNISSAELERLEEIVCRYDFSVDSIEGKTDGQSIAEVLIAARNNEQLWEDLAGWNEQCGMSLDLVKLRQSLPVSVSDESPEALLAAVGVKPSELPTMLSVILAHRERQEALAQAFDQDSPATTAEALESIVNGDVERTQNIWNSPVKLSLTSIIIYFIILVAFLLLMNMTATLYKGVTPQRGQLV